MSYNIYENNTISNKYDDEFYSNRMTHNIDRVNASRDLFNIVFERVSNNIICEQRKKMFYSMIDRKIQDETNDEYDMEIKNKRLICDYGIWADIITKKYDFWRLYLENMSLDDL